MTSTPITPAMTSEEWADFIARPIVRNGAISRAADCCEPFADSPDRHDDASFRHACAALCLYNQPFGFTREMVKALPTLLPTNADSYFEMLPTQQDVDLAWAVVDRIEALLPPQL